MKSPGGEKQSVQESSINCDGPLSVEWEDSGMDREHGAAEACDFVRSADFPPLRNSLRRGV